jgi:hypothetical protein
MGVNVNQGENEGEIDISNAQSTLIERLSKIDWEERLAGDALMLYLRQQFDRESALVSRTEAAYSEALREESF